MLANHSIGTSDAQHDDSSVKSARAANPRSRLVWAVVGIVVACVLGVGVFGAIGPKPCTSCHDRGSFRAQTQASPHANVDCRRCHMAAGGVGQVLFVLQQPLHAYPQSRAADRDAAAVSSARCSACHAEALKGTVVSNGIRMKHSSCAANASCTDCHSSIAHGSATQWVRSYDMDSCLECHMATDNVKCNLCHEGREVTDRVKFAAFAVTHGPKWKTTHGMGDAATCSVCHKANDCADCHGSGVPHEAKFVDVHSSYATQSKARCGSCHKDSFCDACHGTQMPHPAGFTRRHAAADKAQPGLCVRCHDTTDCTICHLKHVHPGGAIGTTGSVGGGK